MSDDPFIIDDGDRYAPFRLIAWWEQARLAAARVMVVGAGALGNEVLKNLALLGVGHILIVDFDRIESGNLARSVLFRARDRHQSKAMVAAAAVKDLNPDAHVQPLDGNVLTDVGLGLFRDVDVVIGCLDNREARLWVNRCCWKVGTPWIDGGIQEINGVVKMFVPPHGACYECAMTETDYQLINLRYSCPLLRHEDLAAGKVPTAPTIASIIAGLQTQEALKLIHGWPVAAGEAMVFNGVANQFYRTRFQLKENCLSHETYPVPREVPLTAAQDTAAAVFHAARGWFGNRGLLALELDRDLVVSLVCPPCEVRTEVMRPLPQVSVRDASCPQCGQPMRPELSHRIVEDSPLAARRLAELGIPPYDLLRITNGTAEQILLLAADRAAAGWTS